MPNTKLPPLTKEDSLTEISKQFIPSNLPNRKIIIWH